MLIYALSFSLTAFGAVVNKRKNSYVFFFICFYLCFFLCFGYMTGSDWRPYELAYLSQNINNPLAGKLWEPGYPLYSLLFKIIGFEFWPFFIITKCFLFFICIYTISKYTLKNKTLELHYFVYIFGLYLFIDNPMRNLIAVCIYTFAYKHLLNRSAFKYYLVVALCVFFHKSSLLLLLIYPIYSLKFTSRNVLCTFIALNILMLFFSEYFLFFLESISSHNSLLASKFDSYFLQGNVKTRFFSIGFVLQCIYLLLILKLKKKFLSRGKVGEIVFKFSILYILLYRIGLYFDIFYRLQLYFALLYSIGVIFLVNAFSAKSKVVYYSLILFFSGLVTYKTITTSSMYIPYSNYIEYILVEKPNFHFRSIYNYQKSPYKKDE